jgi:hypothetical protein
MADSAVSVPRPDSPRWHNFPSLRSHIDNVLVDRNNTFGRLQRNGDPSSPNATALARVGVYDVHGINETRFTPTAAPLVPIPDTLQTQITASLAAGRNTDFPSFGFNDASLKSMNIVPILLSTTPALPLTFAPPSADSEITDLRVTQAAVTATYQFDSMPVTTLETGSLTVKVCCNREGPGVMDILTTSDPHF